MNKTVLVTGASSGLGRALSVVLAKKGYRLILCSRDIEKLRELSKELGEESVAVWADVKKEADVKKAFSYGVKKFRAVDILICCAGINDRKLFYEYSEDEWDSIMDTNAKSVFMCVKEFQRHNKNGIIVIVSSMAGLFGAKYYSVYCASKHALEGFARSIRKETECRVHIFHPYRLNTNFHKNYRIKSPEKHMIAPEKYAEYMIAKIEGDYFLSAYYFLRNWLLWAVKSVL